MKKYYYMTIYEGEFVLFYTDSFPLRERRNILKLSKTQANLLCGILGKNYNKFIAIYPSFYYLNRNEETEYIIENEYYLNQRTFERIS